jgi:hypothetical protein
MTTLNGGFAQVREVRISDEDQILIDEFIRKKGIQKVQPAGADSNEASRATKERIAQARKEFREARKTKKK